MLKKIEVKEAEKFSKSLNIDSYPVNPYWLAFRCFHEKRNKENLIYERDIIYENDFPFLAMPKNKSNWVNAIITNAGERDLQKIKKSNIKIKNSFIFGNEYYYKTKGFISLEGSEFRNFRKAANRFKNRYNSEIKSTYPQNKILQFLDRWKKTQKNKNELFNISHEYEIFCIKKCKNIKGEWLFIEINKKLVAYCLSYKLNKDFWIGVHQKVDYKYKGLSRFLMHKRASLFPKTKFFTLGTQARDLGIEKFKEGLHPFKKENRCYIITN